MDNDKEEMDVDDDDNMKEELMSIGRYYTLPSPIKPLEFTPNTLLENKKRRFSQFQTTSLPPPKLTDIINKSSPKLQLLRRANTDGINTENNNNTNIMKKEEISIPPPLKKRKFVNNCNNNEN
eukprot:359997_1